MQVSVGEPSPLRAIFAFPDGTIKILSPAMPIPEGISEVTFIDALADSARANAILSGDQSAILMEHVVTLHRSEIEPMDKRWGGVGRAGPDGSPVFTVTSCLRWVGGQVVVDPVAARSHLLAEIRILRDQKLQVSDSDKARIDEIGTPEQKKAIKDYRQALRDLPATVAAEIATLSVAQLEIYRPKLPTENQWL